MARTCLVQKSKKPSKHKVQHRNRCNICGRARAYYRKFGVCRICLRNLAHRGEIPGLRKASW
jgi:small subunit ribosomal protein S14